VSDDREAIKARATEAAFDTGRDCEHCQGSGRVYPGRRVIHSIWGGLGADWDLEAVLHEIDRAARVEWAEDQHHALAVYSRGPGGPPILFAVWPPEADEVAS
jgi:hypothetical protein